MNDLVEIRLRDFQIVTQHISNNIKTRRKHSASLLGNCMIVFGGFNGEYHQDLHYVELENNCIFSENIETKWSNQESILNDQEFGDIEFTFEGSEDSIIGHKYIMVPSLM